MNAENIALCAPLRKPVGKRKPLAYSEIARLVKKADGTRPTKQGVWKAVQSMNESKAKRGRKKAWRKTSKRDDSNILQTFKRLRPDGHGVDSRIIHTNLPRQLRRKVCRRTVRRRLAEKDFVCPEKRLPILIPDLSITPLGLRLQIDLQSAPPANERHIYRQYAT